MNRARFALLAALTLGAAASRLVPHPLNVAPVGAMALFGGACFASRRAAFAVPLAAMFLSDLALGLLSGDPAFGLHRLVPVVYGSFALAVCLGFWLRNRRTALPIAAATLAGSVLFFVVTNFGLWALCGWYPLTWDGLASCYAAAVPYFRNTLAGDAAYSAALFGGLALAERGVPAFRVPEPAPVR